MNDGEVVPDSDYWDRITSSLSRGLNVIEKDAQTMENPFREAYKLLDKEIDTSRLPDFERETPETGYELATKISERNPSHSASILRKYGLKNAQEGNVKKKLFELANHLEENPGDYSEEMALESASILNAFEEIQNNRF